MSASSQQQLRLLMRQQAAASSSGLGSASTSALSGKDKVKALKAMKQQQQSLAASTAVPIAHNKLQSNSNSISGGGLPAGFFDESPSVTTATTSTAAPILPAVDVRRAHTAVPISQPTPTPTPAVPVGFFDDVEQDHYARGINYAELVKQHEQAEQQELSSFMHEIGEMSKEIEVEEEEAQAAEDAEQEVEEQLVQLSYVARVAQLLRQSDKLVSPTVPANSNSTNAVTSGVSDMLNVEQVVEEATAILSMTDDRVVEDQVTDKDELMDGSGTHGVLRSANESRGQRVADIVQQKLMQMKRQREAMQLHSAVPCAHAMELPSEKKAKTDSTASEGQTSNHSHDNDVVENEDELEDEVDDDEEEEEDYSPLDFMNFQGRY